MFSYGNRNISRANSRYRKCARSCVYRNGGRFLWVDWPFLFVWMFLENYDKYGDNQCVGLGCVSVSIAKNVLKNCADSFYSFSVFLVLWKNLFLVSVITNNSYNSLNNWLFHFIFNEKFRNVVGKIYRSDLEVYMPFNLFNIVSSYVPIFVGSMSFVYIFIVK